GVEAYVIAEPVLGGCVRRMKEQGIALAYFHEGHLDTDQIRAWFEQRPPRRRVTTDMMVKLGERYMARGDHRAASHALRIAEATADLREPETAEHELDAEALARAASATCAGSKRARRAAAAAAEATA